VLYGILKKNENLIKRAKKFYKRYTKWSLPNKFTTLALAISILYIIYAEFIKPNPVKKEIITEALYEFQERQNEITDSLNNGQIEKLSSFERANEESINKFLIDNPKLNSIIDDVQIPIVYYIIGDSSIINVKEEQLQSQNKALNKEFKKHGISFINSLTKKFGSDYLGSTSLDITDFKYIRNFANLIDRDKSTLNVIVTKYSGLAEASMPLINSRMSKEKNHMAAIG